MHTNISFLQRLLPLVAGVLLALQISSEAGDLQQAEAVVQKAQTLAANRQTQEAIRALEQAYYATNWPPPGDALLAYTLGSLLEQAASLESSNRQFYTDHAVRSYQKVLESYPGHAQTSERLALLWRQAGRMPEAIELLKRVSTTNETPADTYSRLATLGDLHVDVGNHRSALDYYQKAFALNPQDERVPWRMVAYCPSLPQSWSEDLFRLSEQFASSGQLQPALRCFEEVMRKEGENGISSRGQNAFDAWVELEGQRDTFTSASLERLPAAYRKTRGTEELNTVIKDTVQAEFSYWRSSELRRHIAATAIRSLAHEAQREGGDTKETANERRAKIKRAEALYRIAFNLAPQFEQYKHSLAGRPIVGLDVGLELASLYHLYPELDRGQDMFRQLESRLLGGKDNSYVVSDVQAMEKYHTVLGMIYAERGDWKPDDRHGAPYHLKRAVEVAQRRAGRNPSEYQPLPHLTRLLAEGTAQVMKKPTEARDLYLRSAQGYLDRDDLVQTDKMLKAANAISKKIGQQDPVAYKGLQTLLEQRKAIKALRPEDFGADTDLRAKFDLAASPPGVDPAFVNRQRIRTLSDLGGKAAYFGASKQSGDWRREAVDAVKVAPGATQAELKRLDPDLAKEIGSAKPVLVKEKLGPEQTLLNDQQRRNVGSAHERITTVRGQGK